MDTKSILWDKCNKQTNLNNLIAVFKEKNDSEKKYSPIIILIEKFVKKNIVKMFMSRDSELKLSNEMEKEGDAVVNLRTQELSFSAFRTLNITGDRDYVNSPILIFFSVFKSWFYHHMLFIAKNLEIAYNQTQYSFLLNKNFLSIWKNKNDKNSEIFYSSEDAYVEYDRFLRNDKIKKDIEKVIDMLYGMFIQNDPIKFLEHVRNKWKTKIFNMSIEEFIDYIKNIENPTKRFQMYLFLIDEILFKTDININYEFKLFFSLQGILITLNCFMQISEDIGNINLFNILNKEFVSEYNDLSQNPIYMNFIIDTLQNFFEFDDLSKETTRDTTNNLLIIFCSIFNVKLTYSCYPIISEKNGVKKERMRIKKIFPSFELMNRIRIDVVKSVNIEVMLYTNLISNNTYYLYNDEEILNFNLQDNLLERYNIIEFPHTLQQNLVNKTALGILETSINVLKQIQDSNNFYDNNNLQKICNIVYQNLCSLNENVEDCCHKIIPLFFDPKNNKDKIHYEKINKNFEEYENFDPSQVANIFCSQIIIEMNELDIFNEYINKINHSFEETMIKSGIVSNDKSVNDTSFNINANHYIFSVNDHFNFNNISPIEMIREGYSEQNNFKQSHNNESNQYRLNIGGTLIPNNSILIPTNVDNYKRPQQPYQDNSNNFSSYSQDQGIDYYQNDNSINQNNSNFNMNIPNNKQGLVRPLKTQTILNPKIQNIQQNLQNKSPLQINNNLNNLNNNIINNSRHNINNNQIINNQIYNKQINNSENEDITVYNMSMKKTLTSNVNKNNNPFGQTTNIQTKQKVMQGTKLNLINQSLQGVNNNPGLNKNPGINPSFNNQIKPLNYNQNLNRNPQNQLNDNDITTLNLKQFNNFGIRPNNNQQINLPSQQNVNTRIHSNQNNINQQTNTGNTNINNFQKGNNQFQEKKNITNISTNSLNNSQFQNFNKNNINNNQHMNNQNLMDVGKKLGMNTKINANQQGNLNTNLNHNMANPTQINNMPRFPNNSLIYQNNLQNQNLNQNNNLNQYNPQLRNSIFMNNPMNSANNNLNLNQIQSNNSFFMRRPQNPTNIPNQNPQFNQNRFNYPPNTNLNYQNNNMNAPNTNLIYQNNNMNAPNTSFNYQRNNMNVGNFENNYSKLNQKKN